MTSEQFDTLRLISKRYQKRIRIVKHVVETVCARKKICYPKQIFESWHSEVLASLIDARDISDTYLSIEVERYIRSVIDDYYKYNDFEIHLD